MSTDLHVHRYGPEEPVRVLTIHGVTEHGQSWEYLAGYLPEVNIAAPDLLGHGRSSWAAPWSIDANVSALAALLKDQADGPVVVVGHSFGGAVALQLAAAHPDLVAALILLDPAIGLDGSRVREVVDAMVAFPDYTDPAEARMERAYGAWADVDPAVLDAELDEHLITLPNGRYSWRISCPPWCATGVSSPATPRCLPRESRPRWCGRCVPIRSTSATNSSRPCGNGWEPTSPCGNSSADTWFPRPNPLKSPH